MYTKLTESAPKLRLPCGKLSSKGRKVSTSLASHSAENASCYTADTTAYKRKERKAKSHVRRKSKKARLQIRVGDYVIPFDTGPVCPRIARYYAEIGWNGHTFIHISEDDTPTAKARKSIQTAFLHWIKDKMRPVAGGISDFGACRFEFMWHIKDGVHVLGGVRDTTGTLRKAEQPTH